MWLLIALAGALGAGARFAVDAAISARVAGDRPWGTFVVNISGSLAAGVVVGAAAGGVVSGDVQQVVAGGFLGAYTTFSTHAVDSVGLLQRGDRVGAVANLVGSALLGTVLAALGLVSAAHVTG